MSRLSRFLASLFVALALIGCAAPKKVGLEPQGLLRDAEFKPPAQKIPAAEEVFAASPEMRAYIQEDPAFLSMVRRYGERDALIESFRARPLLRLDYESSMTRNAAEAFAARSGNCLSLVIMTAALARELHVPVHFQVVYTDESWSRNGDLYFVAGHVNLSLGTALRSSGITSLVEPDLLVIDFVPPDSLRGYRRMEVDERTIIAMYYNNRAAESLEAGATEEAYWWARAAVLAEPHYLSAFNTLAVVYRRHGNSTMAETALREVLRLEPENVQALSNLVLVMRGQHRDGEADQLQAKLSEIQPYPPFKYFDLGVEAMKLGDFNKARDMFKREISRSAFYHEFHFWLALADYALGDVREAGKQLALALENSPTRRTHDLYAAKLAWLEQQQRPKEPPSFLSLPPAPGGPNRSF